MIYEKTYKLKSISKLKHHLRECQKLILVSCISKDNRSIINQCIMYTKLVTKLHIENNL